MRQGNSFESLHGVRTRGKQGKRGMDQATGKQVKRTIIYEGDSFWRHLAIQAPGLPRLSV
jgi:hypothetical protein